MWFNTWQKFEVLQMSKHPFQITEIPGPKKNALLWELLHQKHNISLSGTSVQSLGVTQEKDGQQGREGQETGKSGCSWASQLSSSHVMTKPNSNCRYLIVVLKDFLFLQELGWIPVYMFSRGLCWATGRKTFAQWWLEATQNDIRVTAHTHTHKKKTVKISLTDWNVIEHARAVKRSGFTWLLAKLFCVVSSLKRYLRFV